MGAGERGWDRAGGGVPGKRGVVLGAATRGRQAGKSEGGGVGRGGGALWGHWRIMRTRSYPNHSPHAPASIVCVCVKPRRGAPIFSELCMYASVVLRNE